MEKTIKPAPGRLGKPVNEEKFRSVCKRWNDGEITARRAMYEMNMSAATFYRRAKERGYESKAMERERLHADAGI